MFSLRCFIVVLFDIPNVWNTPYNVSIVVDLIGVCPELPTSQDSFQDGHVISLHDVFRDSGILPRHPPCSELFFIILLMENSMIYRVLYVPGGCLGFLPSTVTLAKNLPFRAF